MFVTSVESIYMTKLYAHSREHCSNSASMLSLVCSYAKVDSPTDEQMAGLFQKQLFSETNLNKYKNVHIMSFKSHLSRDSKSGFVIKNYRTSPE